MRYYGDSMRWFLATVVDINDPLEMGRVRVRIHGIHTESTEDIPTCDLPFAQVMADIRQGGVSGIGSNVGLKENAQVFGIFLDGKSSQVPLVLGSLTKIEGTPSYELRQLIEENTDEIARINDKVNEISETVRGVERHKPTSEQSLYETAGSNAEKIFLFLKSKEGGSLGNDQNRGAIVGGIIGNLMAEGGQGVGNRPAVDQIGPPPTKKIIRREKFDIYPDALNATEERSLGIAQWNPATERVRNLIKFSAERNVDPLSLRAQVRFIKTELYAHRYFGVEAGLFDVKPGIEGVEQAAEIFEKKYERSADGAEGISKRKKFAREAFNKFEDNQ